MFQDFARSGQIDRTARVCGLTVKAQRRHRRGETCQREMIVVLVPIRGDHPISGDIGNVFAGRCRDEDALQCLRENAFALQIARKSIAAGPHRRRRCRILRDGGESAAKTSDIVHILDRDAAVAVRQPPVIRELANNFGRADEAFSAHQNLERNDRCVMRDRKTLLEATNGQASTQEFGHAPVRYERNLEDAVNQAASREPHREILSRSRVDHAPSRQDRHLPLAASSAASRTAGRRSPSVLRACRKPRNKGNRR